MGDASMMRVWRVDLTHTRGTYTRDARTDSGALQKADVEADVKVCALKAGTGRCSSSRTLQWRSSVLIVSEAMAVTHVWTLSSCPPASGGSSSGSSALLLTASGGEAMEEQEAGEEEEEEEEDGRSWWWTPTSSSSPPPVSSGSGSKQHSMLLSLACGLRAEEEEVQVEEEVVQEEEGWACSIWTPPMGRRGSRLRPGCWECRGRWLRRFCCCRALAPHGMLGARAPPLL